MDSDGVMKVALADMDIIEHMTIEHLEKKAHVISESSIVVLDTNLPQGIINYLVDRFSARNTGQDGKKPLFFLDAVSARKAPKALDRIESFDTLKLGQMEASALSNINIPIEAGISETQESLLKAADWFISMGVKRVFITLGK
jgi:pseudouridine kinase